MNNSFGGAIQVEKHIVVFRYPNIGNSKKGLRHRLAEEASKRALQCINNGYRQGKLIYVDGENEYYGLWEIAD